MSIDVLVASAIVLLTFESCAHAGLMFVNSRAALNGDDHIDWSQLGGVGTTVPDTSPLTTALGSDVSLEIIRGTTSSAFVVDELLGLPSISNTQKQFGGDLIRFFRFAITLRFDVPVEAAGADVFIFADQKTGAFPAGGPNTVYANWSINARDANGQSLGTFGGAVRQSDPVFEGFAGVRSDAGANISAIVFNVSTVQISDNVNNKTLSLEINQVDLDTGNNVNAVPEPSSLLLLGMGAFGVFGYGRRRHRLHPSASS